ncbi:hypothetical protein QTO01_07400 [Vibrio mytili]
MSTEDWCVAMAITESKHWNLMSGRTKGDQFAIRKMSDLVICQSYVLEATAFLLTTETIDGKHVDKMSAEEFGKNSIAILGLLRNSYDVLLQHYWSHRSHIDVGQSYIYMQTHNERLDAKGLQMKRLMYNKSTTPEYHAFLIRPVKAERKKKQDRNLIMTMLEMSAKSRMSAEQQEGVKSLDQ